MHHSHSSQTSPHLTCSLCGLPIPSPPLPSHVVCHVVFHHGVLVIAVRNVFQFLLLQTTNEATYLHVSQGREEGRKEEEKREGERREGGGWERGGMEEGGRREEERREGKRRERGGKSGREEGERRRGKEGEGGVKRGVEGEIQ